MTQRGLHADMVILRSRVLARCMFYVLLFILIRQEFKELSLV